MKTKNKMLSFLSLAASATATISILNKVIFQKAIGEFPKKDFISHTYHWRFGDISYTQSGSGRPILLLHSLNSFSSSYEWHKIIEPLSKSRTVYALDLLGCGYSEKPDFTYTNFVFVQLLNDFITNVIGRRTDIVTSENSSSIALMACVYNPDLFDKIMMINPSSISRCSQVPNQISKIWRFYYNLPILGTFAYNIAFSKKCITEDLQKSFGNVNQIDSRMVDTMYQNAHFGEKNARYLYSSIRGNYTNVSISNILRQINNGLYILGGELVPNIEDTIKDYQTLNSSIESNIVENCKDYAALENPEAVLDMIAYI